MLPAAQFEAWTMEDCDYGRPLSQLVTVVIQGHSHEQVFGPFWLLRSILSVQVIRMVKSLQEAYPGVAAIVETDLNLAQVTCAMSVNLVMSMTSCHSRHHWILVRVLRFLPLQNCLVLQAGGNGYQILDRQICIYFSMAPIQLYIRVKTEFVLLAGDLDWGGGWMNLERAIRLLTQVSSNKKNFPR